MFSSYLSFVLCEVMVPPNKSSRICREVGQKHFHYSMQNFFHYKNFDYIVFGCKLLKNQRGNFYVISPSLIIIFHRGTEGHIMKIMLCSKKFWIVCAQEYICSIVEKNLNSYFAVEYQNQNKYFQSCQAALNLYHIGKWL